MSFEKLTGLVNLEELEVESDLNNTVGGTIMPDKKTVSKCPITIWWQTRVCYACAIPAETRQGNCPAR